MMTNKAKKTKLISTKIPKLIPLDYCTVERAAKMLEIEEEDIKHFNEAGYIALYNRLEDSSTIDDVWNDELDAYNTCTFSTYRFVPYFVAEINRHKYDYCSDEVYIKYAGLKAIYGAIYEGKELSKEKPTFINPKPARVDQAPSNFIAALLELLPDLKEKIEKTPTNAPQIVDDHLKKKGLPSVNLGINNLSNWLNKSTYNK